MKVLIYTPPSDLNYVRIGRCGGSTKSGTEFPPIKLMYLAGLVKEPNSLLFIDADAEELSLEKFLKRVGKFQPNIMVAEPTPSSLKDELVVVKEVKKIVKNVKAIFIGPFVSAVSENILNKYKEIDCIIKGEAEAVLKKIIKGKIEAKGTLEQEIIENLDNLPMPIHNLIPKNEYISAFIKKRPYTIMETSRGCPFACTYCNAFLSGGRVTRFRSVGSIVKELKFIKSLRIEGIYFNDETFTLDKERVKKLMQEMIKEKFNFSWVCNSRVDTIDEEILRLMKKAGCSCIFYGVESGNQEILDYYQKKTKLEQIVQAFKLTKKIGIETVAHFILGAPEESTETIKKTVNFAKKINPDLVSFNILTPYPGTEVFKDLKKRNFIEVENWSSLDQSIKSTLKTEYLTAKELELEMKKAYKSFYYRPNYIFKKLIGIRSFYDITKLMKGFFGFLKLVK